MSARMSAHVIVLMAALAAPPAWAKDKPAKAAPAKAVAEPPPAPQPAIAVEPEDDKPYDPLGKRDPFRPPRSGTPGLSEARTPLQRYELGQLRLVAVIYETGDPRAVVEDSQGLGYIVKVGTAIGPNGGEVRAIERGRIVVQEQATDFYGESHPNEVSLELRELRTAERGKK